MGSEHGPECPCKSCTSYHRTSVSNVRLAALEAVAAYAAHESECDAVYHGGGTPCSCGLAAALSKLDEHD